MFEQASIDTRGALTSPWALAISITGQTLAVGAVILFSLIRTEVIRPPSFLATTLTVPLGSPPPPVQLEQRTVVRSSTRTMNAFVAPSRPPATIDMSPDDPPTQPGGDVIVGALPTGIGAGGQNLFSSLLDAIARPAPPVARVEPTPARKADVIAPTKPIPVSTGVQAAKLIRQVKPVYPQLARTARISGVVRLMAIIGKDGAIQNLQVTSGHPLLTPAAVEAVKQWLYQPTLLNGEAVDVITQVDVNFTLSQ